MKYALIENNIVTQIQPNLEEGFVEVSDDIVCGMVQQGNEFVLPPKQFENEIANLRFKRDKLLFDTDIYGLSDRTMSAEMTTYRQALRDITNGLTTVADVEAVVFPEKPEASL